MSENNGLNSNAVNIELKSPFLKVLVKQIRAQDTYGFYRSWSDELIIKPFIVSKQKKREISLEGEVDPATKSRIMSFFGTIAASLEKETGAYLMLSLI